MSFKEISFGFIMQGGTGFAGEAQLLCNLTLLIIYIGCFLEVRRTLNDPISSIE